VLIILRKIIYILIILALNLYLYEYISNKFTARMELRRGYRVTRAAGIGFPMIRFFKFISTDSKITAWTFFIFLLSFLMWSTVPLTPNLILVESDSSLLIAVSLYIGLTSVLIFNSAGSSYRIIFSETVKKLMIILSFMVPLLLGIVSIVLVNKTLSLREIVDSQYKYWNIILQPLGFFTVFASTLFQLKLLGMSRKNYISTGAYTGREGKGFVKAIEKLPAYMIVFFLIIIMNILYLGGWQDLYIIRGEIMLAVKFYFIFFILLLMDKIICRIDNYKMLVKINWKFLIPVSLVNFIITLGFFVMRDIYNLV
jgi:NADH-quinone oxidoreductase subunit H